VIVTRDISVDWGTSGVSTLAYRVVDTADATLVARTTSGVTEFPAGSGQYHANVANWNTTWAGRVIWDDGTDFASEEFAATDPADGGGVTGTSVRALVFTRTLHNDTTGDYEDADSATIGIVRTDTGAVIVPAGTAMDHDGLGRYSKTMADPIAGVTYRATSVLTIGGNSLTTTSDKSATAGGSAGAYASQSDVQDLIGPDNLDVLGDLDDDGNLDSGIVQRALDFADSYINLELLKNGLTAPASLTNATHAAVLKDVAAHLAVWHLWHHRGLKEAPGRGRPDGIGGVFDGYKGYADEQLAKLVFVLQQATEGDWTAGGDATPITPSLYNNDVNRMVRCREPDAAPIWW
jgi:hypothetical protein